MPIENYTELKSSIADFLNRDDLTSTIPSFIALAEANFNRKIRHWRQEKRSTAIVSAQYTAFPSDFMEPIRFSLTSDNTRRLEMVGQGTMMEMRENNKDTSGIPQFFAITDGSLELFPTPASDHTVEMVYYGKPAALSDSNATNWLLTYYPDAYLYGSLMHSAPYLADDGRIQIWAALLQAAIDGINQDSEEAKFNSAGQRIKIRSY